MSSGRARTAALGVALIALLLLLGACGSGNSNAKAADLADRRAVAANKVAVARARAVYARRAAAAARRRAAKKRSTTSTTTPATPTTIETHARKTPASDLSAIRRTVDSLNAAFRKSVDSGISNANASNAWIADGSYTAAECASFQSTRGRGVVSEHIALHADSLVPDPGWVDPVIGKVPAGRIYRVSVDETQTLVSTGRQRSRTFSIHVTVQADGHARLLLRCR
jgi:hypothetical protein